MTLDDLKAAILADELARHNAANAALVARVGEYAAAQAPAETIVRPGDSLQTAMDGFGRIRVRPGVYEGAFLLRSHTALTLEEGVELRSGTTSAIRAGLGLVDATVVGGRMFGGPGSAGVVQLGLNTSDQAHLADVPRGIRFIGTVIPSHRGRRAFEINATDVELVGCQALDVYDPGGQDSQALSILNTPGAIKVLGGVYQGASENAMLGGDEMKLAGGVEITGVLFDGTIFEKPFAWRVAGIPVKNLFEIKRGHDIAVRNCTGVGCWQSGQFGHAVVVTPCNGGTIRDVLFEGNRWSNVANAIQMTGRNDDSVTPEATRHVWFVRDRFDVDTGLTKPTATVSLFGRLAQVQQEAEDLSLEGVIFTGVVGSSTIYWSNASVMTPDGVTKRAALNPKRLTMRGCRVMIRPVGATSYGLNFGGATNASNLGYFSDGATIEDNVFTGNPAMAPKLPASNRWVSAEEFAALIAA